MTSYIKISQILKLKLKDLTSKILHAKFYASRIKTSELGGGKIHPWVWSVYISPGKIGLKYFYPAKDLHVSAFQKYTHQISGLSLAKKILNYSYLKVGNFFGNILCLIAYLTKNGNFDTSIKDLVS